MANRTDAEANFKIGQMLQLARESKRVTQAEMADAIDMSKNHISAVERGQNKASIDMLLGYCRKLEMTPNEILGFYGAKILPELERMLTPMDEDTQQKLYSIGQILQR